MTIDCARCGRHREHQVRGLCNGCRNAERRAGTLETWPMRRGTRGAAVAEDFLFLYESGMTIASIAEKLGLQHESLLVALRRRGVPITYDRSIREWRMTA